MEKLELENKPPKLPQTASDVEFQCDVPFCNTQDPSSRTLCDKCTMRRYSIALPTTDLSSVKKSKPACSTDPFEYDSRLVSDVTTVTHGSSHGHGHGP